MPEAKATPASTNRMTTQEWVAKAMAEAPPPPLSERQKAALRELLRPVQLTAAPPTPAPTTASLRRRRVA